MSTPESQCSSSFWLSMLDPRPLFSPMSWRRAFTWAAYGGIGAGLYFLEQEYDLIEAFKDGVNEEIIPLMVLTYGYEPVMAMIHMLIAKYKQEPEQAKEETPDELEEKVEPDGVVPEAKQQQLARTDSDMITIELSQKSPQSPNGKLVRQFSLPRVITELVDIEAQRISPNPDLAIVIPCHNSADIIKATVNACLKHVLPEQVFIIDNGRSSEPTDNTEVRAHNIDPRINYVYLSEIGNKSIAVFCGAHWANINGYALALIIDDDVLLPESYFVNHQLIDQERVKAVVYPILADSKQEHRNWLVKQQRFEYQFSDLEMAYLDRTNSVVRPHGACSLWQVPALIHVMEKHNTTFHGEDMLMGFIMRNIKDENGRYVFRIDMANHFKTYVPETIFGTGGNLYQQRVRSWSEAQYKHFWGLSIKPFFTIWPSSNWGKLALKNAQIYNLHSQLMHIIRYPIMAAAADNPNYWIMLGASVVIQELIGLGFNYAKLPKELRNSFWTVITHPLYKMMDHAFGTLGFLRAIFIGIPGLKNSPSISRRIANDTLPPPSELLPIAEHKGDEEKKPAVQVMDSTVPEYSYSSDGATTDEPPRLCI